MPGKKLRRLGVLSDVTGNAYGDARLVRLLRLLRPAPHGWMTKAQQIFFEGSLGDSAAAGSGLNDQDLAGLERRLGTDPSFRRLFEADPVAAAEGAGLYRLASKLEQAMREVVALAERIARDDVYRAELEADPLTAVAGAGIPAASAEPLLRALAMPDTVLSKLPDVVAHQSEGLSVRARLLILLLGTPSVAEQLRAATQAD
jgi:hypothetical protein